jgi:hypothetical protein
MDWMKTQEVPIKKYYLSILLEENSGPLVFKPSFELRNS